MDTQFVTLRGAAKELNRTLDTVYRLLWSGRLQGSTKVDGEWKIPLAAIEQRKKQLAQKSAGAN